LNQKINKMRKVILITVLIVLSATVFGQAKHRQGLLIGDERTSGTNIAAIDSMCIIDGKWYTFHEGDTVDFGVLAVNQIDGFTVYARKFLTDTLLVTAATATMDATWAGKVVRFSNATYCEVTIPANTMGVGAVVTLIRTSVAGPIRVNGAATVIRSSVLDSCTMNTAKQTYQILFRTTNKPDFIGNWID